MKDVLYSGGNTLKKKLFWKLDSAVLKIIPFFSVAAEYFIHFFTIQKLISLAREKRVELINLNTQLSRDFFGLGNLGIWGFRVFGGLGDLGIWGLFVFGGFGDFEDLGNWGI